MRVRTFVPLLDAHERSVLAVALSDVIQVRPGEVE